MGGAGFFGSPTQAGAPTTGATTNTATATTTSPTPSVPAPTQSGSTTGFQLADQTTVPGTSLTGMPSWISDFQSSGSGDMNAWFQNKSGYSMAPGAMPPEQTFSQPAAPPTSIPLPAAAAAPAAKPQYTVIPMNAVGGYNSPGQMGNFTVNDQWDGYGSRQVGTPQYTQPQLMSGPIYTDGKGGYFSKDPSGKIVPVGSGGGASDQFAADYVKKFFDAQGYGAQT